MVLAQPELQLKALESQIQAPHLAENTSQIGIKERLDQALID